MYICMRRNTIQHTCLCVYVSVYTNSHTYVQIFMQPSCASYSVFQFLISIGFNWIVQLYYWRKRSTPTGIYIIGYGRFTSHIHQHKNPDELFMIKFNFFFIFIYFCIYRNTCTSIYSLRMTLSHSHSHSILWAKFK